jgi:hypothetical protein
VIAHEPKADYHFFSTSAIVGELAICYSVIMTEKQQRVILYGDSVILSGVRASLEICTKIEVLVVDQPPDKAVEELRILSPSAVIFDSSETKPDSLFSLLQQPGLLLIGIDPETHHALVWSGKNLHELSMPDLFQVLYIRKPKRKKT